MNNWCGFGFCFCFSRCTYTPMCNQRSNCAVFSLNRIPADCGYLKRPLFAFIGIPSDEERRFSLGGSAGLEIIEISRRTGIRTLGLVRQVIMITFAEQTIGKWKSFRCMYTSWTLHFLRRLLFFDKSQSQCWCVWLTHDESYLQPIKGRSIDQHNMLRDIASSFPNYFHIPVCYRKMSNYYY